MANEFDSEMDRLEGEAAGKEAPKSRRGRLDVLCDEIKASDAASQMSVDCEIRSDGLLVTVKDQAVGLWRVAEPGLALYRPGSPDAECHVSTVADAAKMTARLIAAASQA